LKILSIGAKKPVIPLFFTEIEPFSQRDPDLVSIRKKKKNGMAGKKSGGLDHSFFLVVSLTRPPLAPRDVVLLLSVGRRSVLGRSHP